MDLFIKSSFILLLFFVIQDVNAEDCEVCVKFLTKFDKSLEDDVRKSDEKLTAALKKTCSKSKNKENKFCYYVGGLKDSATYILKEITKPLSYYKPVKNICEALKRKDKQICDLVYDKELDWKTVDFKKMRVRELKKVLSDWDETCSGCLEKSEFIDKIKKVMNKHVEL